MDHPLAEASGESLGGAIQGRLHGLRGFLDDDRVLVRAVRDDATLHEEPAAAG